MIGKVRARFSVHRLGLALMTVTFLAPLASAAPKPSSIDDTPRLVEFEDLGLNLTLPDLAELQSREEGISNQRRGLWTGQLGPAQVAISFWLLPNSQFGFQAPEDVLEIIEENRQRREKDFHFTDKEIADGEFGYAPFASFARSDIRLEGETSAAGNTYFLAALLRENGYMVEVECRPAATGEHEQAILDFLEKGVRYSGEVWNVKWTEEEARDRWLHDAPEGYKGDFKIIRTKHYIIFTNSSGGQSFAKYMEEFYRKIQKQYPFEEVKGNRLMPVFLFRNADEYYDFYVKIAKTSKEAARRSKGHAWRDYYATWYEAPNDPTHLHEATHQIFRNRLRLSGGGSWFQEGVAEYISTSKNELNVVARAVKDREHVALREFFVITSMLYSAAAKQTKGGNEASDNYTQAALVIEFVHRSKSTRKSFQEFLHAVGKTRRNDLPAIERAIQSTLGLSLDEFEEEFVKYCHMRR